MKKKVYLGIVNKDFELNAEAEEYFRKQHIKVLGFMKNIDVIKLESEADLSVDHLKYIAYLELDHTVTIQSDDDC